MIIFGYPGIGKSSLVKEGFSRPDCRGAIDLESSMFKTDMNPDRSPDWYQAYGNIAIDLSNQGFLVFCACHPMIRDYIAKKVPNNNYWIIYPTVDVREEWLNRLRQRYFDTKSILPVTFDSIGNQVLASLGVSGLSIVVPYPKTCSFIISLVVPLINLIV